jgi:hypothetical protein
MAFADEALISRTVRSIDPAAQKVTLETTAKGKTRQLMIDIKPASWTVRFTRSTEPGNIGFVEQTAALAGMGCERHD